MQTERDGVAMSSQPILRVEGVSRRFRSTQALDGLTLEIPRGQIVGLLGRNGAGKSTLLRIVGGMLKPNSGAVTLDGEAVYADAEPGVDVKIRPLRTGFEQLYVVKSRPQAAVSWQVPLTLPGLTARADDDGGVSFVDADGTVASRLLPARAWDAKAPSGARARCTRLSGVRSGDPSSRSRGSPG